MLIFTKLVIYSLILTRNKDYKSFKNEWEHLLTRHALIIKYFLDMIWFLSKHFSWTLSLTLVLSYISYCLVIIHYHLSCMSPSLIFDIITTRSHYPLSLSGSSQIIVECSFSRYSSERLDLWAVERHGVARC